MISTGRIAILILIFLGSNQAIAGDLAYVCEVSHIYELSDNGSLVSSVLEKNMKGSSFTVSRVTGEITGEVIPTLMAKSVRVINKGSKKYSFKAVSDFADQYQVLEIQEFREEAIKPFVASSMGGAGIVTGLCK